MSYSDVAVVVLALVVLSIVLDNPLKPLDPIQKHSNEHFSVDFTEKSACCAYEGLLVREMASLDLFFQKTKEEEVTRDQVLAIGRLCHPPALVACRQLLD
jgi:hypothetical protein